MGDSPVIKNSKNNFSIENNYRLLLINQRHSIFPYFYKCLDNLTKGILNFLSE